MAAAAPPLPTRFPCWCRAIYSWGGESSKDLGFIEKDLIECLNAGDGSWWTGRLYRNKTVGVFPSNFVEVLPENFRPVTRSVTPLTSSNTPSPTGTIQKPKAKPFRKPFEAYAKAPHYTTAKQPEIIRNTSNTPPRQSPSGTLRSNAQSNAGHAPTPPENRGYGSRAPSPGPQTGSWNSSTRHHPRSLSPAPPPAHYRQHHPRALSPAPPPAHYQSRAPSPAPPHSHYHSRAPSPAPSHYHQRAPSPAPPMHHYDSRAPSPAPSHYDSRAPSPAPSFSFKPYRPGAEQDSPPPPAPPPHRNLLMRGNSNASYEDSQQQQDYKTPRKPSPRNPSPGAGGFTPSPLREAMDGVIEQLDALGMPQDHQRHSGSPEPPFDPWSPESFDLVHHRSRKKIRPQTAMGLSHQDSGYESYGGESSQENTMNSGGFKDDHPLPQLSTYVQRMESRLQQMHQKSQSTGCFNHEDDAMPPPPPLKGQQSGRPKSSMGDNPQPGRHPLRKQKSLFDVTILGRTPTTKTNATNSSAGNQSNATTNTQSTDRSLMSGVSAGGISATSAGSLARKMDRARSAFGFRDGEDGDDLNRPTTPFSGVSYHPSHSTSAQRPRSQAEYGDIGTIGGLVQPSTVTPKKSNFVKRMIEAAKTGVATSRSSIAMSPASIHPRTSRIVPGAMTAIAGGPSLLSLTKETARDLGLNSDGDWVRVRRDVNRSNTLSRNERNERRDRCQMMDYPAIDPVDELYQSVEGDEAADGHPVREPTDYQALNLSQVDKSSRFVSNLPLMTTSVTLATTYVCRPYRSEVQRLRAIFIWVAEKINWEEDFEGEVDTRRVISTKKACAEEYAVLVHEMCAAIGIHSEIVRGYLKTPGEVPETTIMPRSNHWWNAVLVDNEWRILDCCLASPSNPRRSLYSNGSNASADPWWFLARPTELCWTHIPEHAAQQHICPPVAHDTLLNLPTTCPPYFKNNLAIVDYNTSIIRIEDLEMVHVKFNVPEDVEVAAEVEVRGYSRDSDGDVFETGETVKKRALAQAEWFNGVKRYTVKALLPGDEGTGILKVYAGKRGLMHSIKDIPHPLAFALPIIHTGENPVYEFVTRHPTPQAQRHDIYVVQPQCLHLAINNTFVFAIRQHPSSSGNGSPSSNSGGASPIPFARPNSAMSMTSSAAASAPSSATGSIAGKKPAKLAIQTPGGKILRLMRKEERRGIGVGGRGAGGGEEVSDGGTWETIIKCSEKGIWRGLVLADRTARWCVFAEWNCYGA
ncbi:hypothetical protein F5Y16DRAFT_273178 [Xylariaceae sp. FL0255]|nr:hypothetical protein F5Y16DRAFT_273178 [Xylariaceae sp. FL0255]